ncbi:MAG: hypothetical protein PHH54_06240 [Candidatus Nanoarchaeia archaeon]|nr:hypothetical protein [Candidatus Nanoarchaeia archaeon]MDD5741554.1 hypothetical protein [Candidatus Nanoarchaeia archaeon]
MRTTLTSILYRIFLIIVAVMTISVITRLTEIHFGVICKSPNFWAGIIVNVVRFFLDGLFFCLILRLTNINSMISRMRRTHKTAICLMIAVLFMSMFCLSGCKKTGTEAGSTLGHHVGCPNCGNSWESGQIGDILFTSDRGVMICKKCLANPSCLDETKIEQRLIDCKWDPEDISLVKKAIIKYKEKKP